MCTNLYNTYKNTEIKYLFYMKIMSTLHIILSTLYLLPKTYYSSRYSSRCYIYLLPKGILLPGLINSNIVSSYNWYFTVGFALYFR